MCVCADDTHFLYAGRELSELWSREGGKGGEREGGKRKEREREGREKSGRE